MFVLALSALVLLSAAGPAAAQTPVASAPTPASAAQSQPKSRRAMWTAVGAGAGFGVGLWAGLRWLDGATYAERKILTTATIGAAAGGLVGNLLARPRKSSPTGSGTTLTLPARATRSTIVAPIVGPGTVGFVYSTRF
jgi:hypothetical protein